MRGNHHTYVHLDRLVTADALDLAFFQHAQQLCLHGHGHVTDFIQKKCSSVGLFELAQMSDCGAGEGTLFVPKEFRFNQFCGHSRTIQGDERVLLPRRFFMDRPCH